MTDRARLRTNRFTDPAPVERAVRSALVNAVPVGMVGVVRYWNPNTSTFTSPAAVATTAARGLAGAPARVYRPWLTSTGMSIEPLVAVSVTAPRSPATTRPSWPAPLRRTMESEAVSVTGPMGLLTAWVSTTSPPGAAFVTVTLPVVGSPAVVVWTAYLLTLPPA